MDRMTAFAACIGLAAASLTAPLIAADGVDSGKREYDGSCAVCHGANGKGGGSFAQMLQVSMPDLTTLAKRNGGVFPATRVYAVIDGREEVKAHGTREMPIWGRHFTYRATPEYDDFACNAEEACRARILLLMDYLYRLQEK